MDEFNPEQRLMVEIMRATGQPDPEAVVRADPIAAALIGSHLRPVFERMAEAAAGACEAYLRVQEVERARRKERRERIIGIAAALAVSLILWWGIIAAVRWAM